MIDCLRFIENVFKLKKRLRNNLLCKPWVNPILKRCIKKKYFPYNLFKRGLISRRSFNRYKNTLTWVMNKVKAKYYKDRFNNHKGDTKKYGVISIAYYEENVKIA